MTTTAAIQMNAIAYDATRHCFSVIDGHPERSEGSALPAEFFTECRIDLHENRSDHPFAESVVGAVAVILQDQLRVRGVADHDERRRRAVPKQRVGNPGDWI